MVRTCHHIDFAAVGVDRIAIVEIRIASNECAARIRAFAHGIRTRARHSTAATMIHARRWIHFAARLGILVAIEFPRDALGELTRSRNARRYRIGRFTRIATRTAMLETRRRIRLASIFVKIVTIPATIVAARNGTCSSNATNVGVNRRCTFIVAYAAMRQTRCRVGFTYGVRIAIAFNKPRRTATSLPSRTTRTGSPT